jgi:hypothetical protein
MNVEEGGTLPGVGIQPGEDAASFRTRAWVRHVELEVVEPLVHSRRRADVAVVAEGRRPVAGATQQLRQGDSGRRESVLDGLHSVQPGPQSGEDRGDRRPGPGRLRHGVLEHGGRLGESVDPR